MFSFTQIRVMQKWGNFQKSPCQEKGRESGGMAKSWHEQAGGGSGGGWMTWRRMNNRVQSGDDRKGIQGGTREARVTTERKWSRRSSQVGPRPQPWQRPTVELMEGGAMMAEGQTNPGGEPTAAEQVAVEPVVETESRWARVTLRIWRAKEEQMSPATKSEVGIRKPVVEPKQLRTKVELAGRKSLTEQEGRDVAWGVESRGGGWSTTDQGGEEGARSHGGATGSKGRGGVRDS